MALLQVIKLPDPRLRLRSEAVTVVDDEIRRLLANMLSTMYAESGIGLAAIQVAVPMRLVVVDVGKKKSENAKPEPMFFINPEITWKSEDVSVWDEGCLSVGGPKRPIERPASIRIRYLDQDGEERVLDASGILATCLQHEIDHLDGITIEDHPSPGRTTAV